MINIAKNVFLNLDFWEFLRIENIMLKNDWLSVSVNTTYRNQSGKAKYGECTSLLFSNFTSVKLSNLWQAISRYVWLYFFSAQGRTL